MGIFQRSSGVTDKNHEPPTEGKSRVWCPAELVSRLLFTPTHLSVRYIYIYICVCVRAHACVSFQCKHQTLFSTLKLWDVECLQASLSIWTADSWYLWELLAHRRDTDSFLSLWLKSAWATDPWQILLSDTLVTKCGMTLNKTFSSLHLFLSNNTSSSASDCSSREILTAASEHWGTVKWETTSYTTLHASRRQLSLWKKLRDQEQTHTTSEWCLDNCSRLQHVFPIKTHFQKSKECNILRKPVFVKINALVCFLVLDLQM